MKKLLIISYFYPPCNLPASQRTYAWSQHLYSNGYYPIIITRNWDEPIKEQKDISTPSGKKVEHVKEKNYEVYYLPYKGNLKDRIFSKHGNSKYRQTRKLLSFFELLFQNYFLSATPLNTLYSFSKKILNEQKDINSVLITGNPFILFKFGYKLKKKFKHINWIADYRDDWTTSRLYPNKNFLNRQLHSIEKRSEKKWLSNAVAFTSISSYYVKKISDYIKIDGKTILNGYNDEDFIGLSNSTFERFTITYNGTLYSSQPIESFLDAFIELIKEKNYDIYINFIGLKFDEKQSIRVSEKLKGYEKHYHITSRIPNKKVIDIQNNSHLLLMMSHSGIKGVTSSKLFEYLRLKKPILLYPNDNDILESIINDTNSGIICNDKLEIYNAIEKFYLIWKEKGVLEINSRNIEKYSRKHQTQKLVETINKLF